MKRAHSISFRLSALLFSLFLLVIFLGLFGIGRLSDFNFVSSDLSSVWLPKTQFLGDLNNYTSDFRAAEASSLLASNSEQLANAEKEMVDLDEIVSTAARNYEHVPRQSAESDLFDDFRKKWRSYRNIVDHEMDLVKLGQAVEATTIYATISRTAYDAASDALGRLTDRNVEYAHLATNLVNDTYRQSRWLISAAMLVAGVLIAAAILYMQRSISRPLFHLSGVMRRLAVNDTSVEIEGTQRPDEIGEMARAAVIFRANAIELTQTQRGLAREAATLAEQLEAEQKVVRSQQNFVSMMSHELRTPLTIVDAIAQRLIKTKDRLNPDQIVDRANRIRRAVLRVTNMIDNLLNASRLMDGDARVNFQPTLIDLKPLLREVCQLHREIAPGSQIVENFDALSARVNGDAKLLFQMFSNLLGNAVKYSTAGKLIKVNFEVVSGQAVIDIIDNGIGIPEKELDSLFARYFRGSNVSSIVGTGIGLYVVNMVVNLHNGTITVESKEGQGARFTVRLPADGKYQGIEDVLVNISQ